MELSSKKFFYSPFFPLSRLKSHPQFSQSSGSMFVIYTSTFLLPFFSFSFLVLPYMKGDNKSTNMQAYFNKLISRLLKQMEIINHINSTN